MLDHDACYEAICRRDADCDGRFYTAVRTTGIFCRPSCPARTPKPQNVRFFASAEAARAAGFRACKRCRPDAGPGSAEWNPGRAVAARCAELIAEGTADREGVDGLARRLGYSGRQLSRLLVDEVGATPVALLRARRAETARALLQTTPLPLVDVAFTAGFTSVRQFNATIREVFARTPTELRSASRRGVTR